MTKQKEKQIQGAAKELASAAHKICERKPYQQKSAYAHIAPNIRGHIIDDEVFGLEWARKFLTHIVQLHEHNIDELNKLCQEWGSGQNIYLTPFTPGDAAHPLKWINDNFEKIGQSLLQKDEMYGKMFDSIAEFGNVFYKLTGHHSLEPNKTQLEVITEQLHAYVSKTNDKLRNKDTTAKELSDQANVLGDYILKNHESAIKGEGACLTAVEIMSDLTNHLNLKTAALDDAMQQFEKRGKEIEELKNVLGQAREQLKVLSPNVSNFDMLLKLVLQYRVNTPGEKLTTEQRNLLNAIKALD